MSLVGRSRGGCVDSSKTASVLRLNVLLQGIGPSIWRRLPVPEAMSLHDLHGMPQAAAGRETLHCFRSRFHGVMHAGAYMYAGPCLPGGIGSVKGNSIDGEILELGHRADCEDSSDVPIS
ncbi:MAG: hypothetical protein OXF56_12985 [Rhodobacteraceae bacterium]|nr:hypothetical protein [Paracoccaceae bacterium]